MNIFFESNQDTDPVLVITLQHEEEINRFGQFFKQKGFVVWKMLDTDQSNNKCFYLAFPLPEAHFKTLSDLISYVLKEEFKVTTKGITFHRDAWQNYQFKHRVHLEAL